MQSLHAHLGVQESLDVREIGPSLLGTRRCAAKLDRAFVEQTNKT